MIMIFLLFPYEGHMDELEYWYLIFHLCLSNHDITLIDPLSVRLFQCLQYYTCTSYRISKIPKVSLAGWPTHQIIYLFYVFLSCHLSMQHLLLIFWLFDRVARLHHYKQVLLFYSSFLFFFFFFFCLYRAGIALLY